MKIETTTGRAKESQHWYQTSGAPCYEIRGKNGQMRPVDLRDARKLGLVPGVSSIMAMEAKPQLVKWQVEQALMAALTLPRIAGEEDGAFMVRAREDAQAQVRKAAARGTYIHGAIQGSFEGVPTASDDLPFVEPVRAWIAQRYGLDGWEAEKSFASLLGYGGKSDISNALIPCVLDIKCKAFGPEKTAKDLAYPEHAMQLAAYRHGHAIPGADAANVFVSTQVPGLVVVREWDEDELRDGWEAFQCLLRLWQIRKKYLPHFAPEAPRKAA